MADLGEVPAKQNQILYSTNNQNLWWKFYLFTESWF